MLRELAPELADAAPGALRPPALPHLRTVIQIGGKRPRHAAPSTISPAWPATATGRELAAARSRSCSSTTRSTSSSPPAPPAARRAPRSPTTTSSTTASSSARRCGSPSGTGSASRCRSITASAWCSATSPALTHGAHHGLSRRGLRPAGHAADRGGGALHRRCMACRPCSSPSSSIRSSRASTCPSCAPASWPARPARSR